MFKRYAVLVLTAAVIGLGSAGCESDSGTTEPGVPNLVVSTAQINLNDANPSSTFTITPDGPGEITWQVVSIPEWMTVSPKRATVSGGVATEIAVTGSSDGLPSANHQTQITVQYTGDGEHYIDVQFAVGPVPAMQVSSAELSFNEFEDQATFIIDNVGNTDFSWSSASTQPYVSMFPSGGTLGYASSVEVTVSIDRNGLASGDHWVGVSVDTDFDDASIGLAIAHYEESFTRLGFNIIDAEYDPYRSRIVAVSADPHQLHIINPETFYVSSIDLSGAPNCVSIGPAGRFAGVGHDGSISVVDLHAPGLWESYSVATDVIDMVMSSEWWAYVFPKTDQWETIRCVNLLTKEVSEHEGNQIFAGTVAKMHPSTKYIYGADNGLTPSDIEKYDISTGIASYLYDSPYHGDYNMGGNLWISDDGSRVFARTGNVFHASSDQEIDMTYAGALAEADRFAWVLSSEAAGRIFAVPEEEDGLGSSVIHVYETAYMVYKGVFELPKFRVDSGESGAFYRARGGYVFANQSGRHFYTLFQAEPDALLENSWAIGRFRVAEAP